MQIELLSLSQAPVKATSMWDGAQRVVEAHGRYADAVARGNCYTVSDTAGHLTPAGLSTAPVSVSLYNPVGSGVFLSLIYAAANISVVFAAIATVWVGVNPTGSAATTGTKIAVQNCNGGGGQGKVQGLTTATLPATPTIFAELGQGLTGAVNLLPYSPSLFKWFDGLIGVGPGGALSIQMAAASAAAATWATWIWEEVPQSGSGPSLTA